MVGHQVSKTLTFVWCSLFLPLIPACDDSDEINEAPAARNVESPVEIALEFDWSAVPIPTTSSNTQLQSPPSSQAFGPWTIESFHYFSPDIIAVTQEPGNLFAPFPAGVQPFPPELSSGFFLGFEFHDQSGDIVGFGSEQEILDFETATGETAYALTVPGRGTLMLSQQEEFAYVFEEINDMIANHEFVRVYDPPLVNIHTVPGTAKVIGGSGEFTHAKGVWREISVLQKLDLVTGQHELGSILQIVRF